MLLRIVKMLLLSALVTKTNQILDRNMDHTYIFLVTIWMTKYDFEANT